MPYSYYIVKDKNVKYILLKILDRISYQVDEFFVLERKNVRKWPFNEFFVELRQKQLDSCYSDYMYLFFTKRRDYTNLIIYCVYYYGRGPQEVADLAVALNRLENNLARVYRYAAVYVDLLDSIAEILVINVYIPRSIYNYYRRRHRDKVVSIESASP
jgi:hypothetical protein